MEGNVSVSVTPEALAEPVLVTDTAPCSAENGTRQKLRDLLRAVLVLRLHCGCGSYTLQFRLDHELRDASLKIPARDGHVAESTCPDVPHTRGLAEHFQ